MDQNPLPPLPNPDFPTPAPEKIPSKKGPTIFILSIVFFALLVTGAAAGYWFYLKDRVEPVACTMEAMICPDGSAVGRTGPNCEFAPCPTPVLAAPIASVSARLMQIPELGIELIRPDGLLDLRYHAEEYDNSTAVLFTTDSLATKFPKCEFPMGGLGWITRVKEPTAIHNKKIGDYYFGIEQAKEACSRSPGSQNPDPLEASQEELFLTLFKTVQPIGTEFSNTYACPQQEWVNCMPTIGVEGETYVEPEQCSQDFLTWAENNCPGFQGAAY